MTLLPVNDTTRPDPAALRAALKDLSPGAPVVIMIHGYRFDPRRDRHDPHRHILSLAPDTACSKAVSWPRHLGLGGSKGLAIGFGWSARGSIWAAHARAGDPGRAVSRLVALIEDVARLAPDRPVHVIAHSLGARLALAALPRLAPGRVHRLILLAAAAFRSEARRAMASPAGASAQVFNVTGPENALFDLLLRAALPLHGPTLGRGLPDCPNWLDLPLSDPTALAALTGLGHRIHPPRRTICHWSGYLRPGVFPLYRALLLRPRETPLALLRAALGPHRPAIPAPLDALPLSLRPTAPF